MSIGLHIGLLCAIASAAVLWAAWSLHRRRSSTPEKREQKRRLALHANGRIGDALVTEATGDALFYTYTIRGVQYEACQDISSLRDLLPESPDRLVGMAGMKYSTRNPADSILLCEEWSGLRRLTNHDTVRHPAENATLAEGA